MPEPWSQAQDETHLCCTPDLFLWLRARLPKVGGALQKYLVGIGAPVCSNRGEKRASCKDHNQRWPQSKMTTKKSQIFGQVEIGGNLTSAVNCEAGDSSFEAAPPPKLASQALSHKLKCKKMKTLSEAMTLIVLFLLIQAVLLRYMCRYYY